MDGEVRLDLVKGLGHALGVPVTADTLKAARREAEEAFKIALEPVTSHRGYSTDADWARVSPEMRQALTLTKASGADQLLGQLQGAISRMAQQMGNDIAKDVMLTTPVSTGLVPYDLEAPAKMLYPTYSPLRNKIPRTKGQGTSRRFKKITQISGSNGTFVNIFMSELPGGSMGVLNLPTAISLTGADASVAYQFMGLSNNASLLAELAGRGYQDIDALVNLTLLQSMMLNEEGAMLYARTSTLAAPTGVTVTAQTPSTGFTNLTGVSTNVYVKVTAVTPFGETTASTAANAAPSSQDVKVTWDDVPGALSYNVYMSTGASDPGDASRFFAGSSSTNFLEIGGAVPTSGNVAPASNGTAPSNQYQGMVQDLVADGGYVKRLNAKLSVGGTEFQDAFKSLWNTNKANPDEIWLSGSDRYQLSQQILAANSGSGAYRISFQRDELGNIVGGQVVTSMWNEVTGKELPISVHPWLTQGTSLILSYAVPFPNSDVPNVFENVMVQDYLGLSFPQIDLARRYAVVAYGALVDYAPGFNAIIQGIESN